MRAAWDERATIKDRRLLLAMAGRVSEQANGLCGRQWGELTGETRAAIVGGLRRWREWSQVDIHAARLDRKARLALLPWHWSRQMAGEYERSTK